MKLKECKNKRNIGNKIRDIIIETIVENIYNTIRNDIDMFSYWDVFWKIRDLRTIIKRNLYETE